MTLTPAPNTPCRPRNLSEQRVFHHKLSSRRLARQAISIHTPKGIKTSHTSDAGCCLVSYAEKGRAQPDQRGAGCAGCDLNRKTDYQSFRKPSACLNGVLTVLSAPQSSTADLVSQIPVTLSAKQIMSPFIKEDVEVPALNLTAEDLTQTVKLDAESVEAP